MKRSKRRAKITVLSGLLALISVLGSGFGITAYYMGKNFGRYEDAPAELRVSWTWEHYAPDYAAEEVVFTSGENTLRGRIYGPENTKGLIVFAHGIGGGHEGYMSFVIRLVDEGWRVFSYDAAGCGRSDGDGSMGLAQSLIDLDSALTFAEGDERLNGLPMFVLGHSWGGYAAAAVLNYDHPVTACVTMSGYDTPYAELTETSDRLLGKAAVMTRPFVWCWNKLTFGKYSSISGVDGINKSGIPVLIVHGTQDDTVEYDGAAIIARREDITNPLAEYYIYDEEKRHNHNDFFTSDEYLPYRDEDNARAAELRKKYKDGKVPDEVIKEFNATINAELYNTINDQLIELIDSFCTKYLPE